MSQKGILFEEISLDDLKPAQRKDDSSKTGVYKKQTPQDPTVLADDPVRETPKITLKFIQHVRKAQMKKRIEVEKRLRVVKKIYKAPPPEAGPI